MGLIKGGFLRLVQTLLYALCFCCAGIALGIYSYFLAVQADRDQGIPRWQKAVEGISGVAVVYTIAAVVLTCCLGGISFFAFTAIVLDILFVGGFIAIAVLTRHGASSCTGTVNTPLGIGNADANESEGFGNNGLGTGQGENLTYSVSPRNACRMNTAVFAVSIIAAFLFLITAVFQVFLVRKHKKEKRFGPGPSNNYTSGPAKRNFWNRKKNTDRDAEKDVVTPAAPGTLTTGHATDIRPSHDTAYTGSTVAAPGAGYDKVDGANGYGAQQHHGHAAHGSHGAYYGAPQGTANPYTMETNQPTYGRV